MFWQKREPALLTDRTRSIAEHKRLGDVGMQYEPLYCLSKTLLSAAEREKLANAYKVYAADFVPTKDGTGS